MARTLTRAAFAGTCVRCRQFFRKDDYVYPWNGSWICVSCERDAGGDPP